MSGLSFGGRLRQMAARWFGSSGSDRRQHPRITGRPLKLVIGGQRYETADWSLSGMRIAGYSPQVRPRQTIAGTILASGMIKKGDFVAEVARILPDGSVGVYFVKLWSETLISMNTL